VAVAVDLQPAEDADVPAPALGVVEDVLHREVGLGRADVLVVAPGRREPLRSRVDGAGARQQREVRRDGALGQQRGGHRDGGGPADDHDLAVAQLRGQRTGHPLAGGHANAASSTS
jgi:hypothetical protein